MTVRVNASPRVDLPIVPPKNYREGGPYDEMNRHNSLQYNQRSSYLQQQHSSSNSRQYPYDESPVANYDSRNHNKRRLSGSHGGNSQLPRRQQADPHGNRSPSKTIDDFYREQQHEIEFSRELPNESDDSGDLFQNPWSALDRHNRQRPPTEDFQSEKSVCSTWSVSVESPVVNDATIPSVIFALQEQKRMKDEQARLLKRSADFHQNPITPAYSQDIGISPSRSMTEDERKKALEHVQDRLRTHSNQHLLQPQQQQEGSSSAQRQNSSMMKGLPSTVTYHPSRCYPFYSPKVNLSYTTSYEQERIPSSASFSSQQQRRQGHPALNRRPKHELFSSGSDLERRHITQEVQTILASAKRNTGKDGIALPRLDVPKDMLDEPLPIKSSDSGISFLTDNRVGLARGHGNLEKQHPMGAEVNHDQQQNDNRNSQDRHGMLARPPKGLFRGGTQHYHQSRRTVDPVGTASTASVASESPDNHGSKASSLSPLDKMRSNLKSKQTAIAHTMTGMASEFRAPSGLATRFRHATVRARDSDKAPLLENERNLSDLFSDIKRKIIFKGERWSHLNNRNTNESSNFAKSEFHPKASVRECNYRESSDPKAATSSRSLTQDDESNIDIFSQPRPDPEASTAGSTIKGGESGGRPFSRQLDKLVTPGSQSVASGQSSSRNPRSMTQVSSLYLPNLRCKTESSLRPGHQKHRQSHGSWMAEDHNSAFTRTNGTDGAASLRGHLGVPQSKDVIEVASIASQSAFTPSRIGGLARPTSRNEPQESQRVSFRNLPPLKPASTPKQPSLVSPRRRKQPFFTNSPKEDAANRASAPVKSRRFASDGSVIVDMASETSDAQSSVSSSHLRKKKVGFHDDVIDVTSLASSRISNTTVKSVTCVDADAKGVIYTKRKVTAMPKPSGGRQIPAIDESAKYRHNYYNHHVHYDRLTPVEELPQSKRACIGKKWGSRQPQTAEKEEPHGKDKSQFPDGANGVVSTQRASVQELPPRRSIDTPNEPTKAPAPEEQIVFASSESRDDLFAGIWEVEADENVGTVVSGLTGDERGQNRNLLVKSHDNETYEKKYAYESFPRRDQYRVTEKLWNDKSSQGLSRSDPYRGGAVHDSHEGLGTSVNPVQLTRRHEDLSDVRRSRQVTPTTENLSTKVQSGLKSVMFSLADALEKKEVTPSSPKDFKMESSPVYARAQTMFTPRVVSERQAPSPTTHSPGVPNYSHSLTQKAVAYNKKFPGGPRNTFSHRGQDAPIDPIQTRDPDGASARNEHVAQLGLENSTVATGITAELREAGIPHVISCEKEDGSSKYSNRGTRYLYHPWDEERRPGGRTLSHPTCRDAPSTIDLRGEWSDNDKGAHSLLDHTEDDDDETELTDRLFVDGDDESQVYEVYPSAGDTPHNPVSIRDESSDDDDTRSTGLDGLQKPWESHEGESFRIRSRRRRKQRLPGTQEETYKRPMFFDLLCRI